MNSHIETMSKDLRRHIMMQQKGASLPPYIQDGLKFWLDGIEKGSNVGVWTDLVGGIRFTPHNVTTYADCYRLNGNNNSFLMGNAPIPVYGGNNFTIELVLKFTVTGTQYVFYGGNSRNIQVVWAINGATILQSYGTRYSSSFNTSIATYSMTTSNGYKNKSAMSKNGIDYWSMDNVNAQIGGIANRMFGGYIYAIRIYNRLLTQDEVFINQQLDIERFGIII